MAGLRSLAGGEIVEYTRLVEDSRRHPNAASTGKSPEPLTQLALRSAVGLQVVTCALHLGHGAHRPVAQVPGLTATPSLDIAARCHRPVDGHLAPRGSTLGVEEIPDCHRGRDPTGEPQAGSPPERPAWLCTANGLGPAPSLPALFQRAPGPAGRIDGPVLGPSAFFRADLG